MSVPAPHAPRILLVDDDAELTAMLAAYLSNAGLEVVTRGSLAAGELALRDAAKRGAAFELAVLDLMLPDGDGLAFCRKLRGDVEAAIAEAGVVMLTARGDEADRIVGLEVGADDYVAKPFAPRELLARGAPRASTARSARSPRCSSTCSSRSQKAPTACRRATRSCRSCAATISKRSRAASACAFQLCRV